MSILIQTVAQRQAVRSVDIANVRALAQQLVNSALEMGLELRISQVPAEGEPLAMGTYVSIVEVWPCLCVVREDMALEKQELEDQQGVIEVGYRHDLDNGWYSVKFPDKKFDGNYCMHRSIEQIARDNGWRIKFEQADSHYNPWGPHSFCDKAPDFDDIVWKE